MRGRTDFNVRPRRESPLSVGVGESVGFRLIEPDALNPILAVPLPPRGELKELRPLNGKRRGE